MKDRHDSIVQTLSGVDAFNQAQCWSDEASRPRGDSCYLASAMAAPLMFRALVLFPQQLMMRCDDMMRPVAPQGTAARTCRRGSCRP